MNCGASDGARCGLVFYGMVGGYVWMDIVGRIYMGNGALMGIDCIRTASLLSVLLLVIR